jgi:hypothetical protein
VYCREQMQYISKFADASTQAFNGPPPQSHTQLLAVADSYSAARTDLTPAFYPVFVLTLLSGTVVTMRYPLNTY